MALFLGALGLPHQGAYNKMTTPGALPPQPWAAGDADAGPPEFSCPRQARGVMEAEADPSRPSPSKGTGESSVLSGHQHKVLASIVARNEELSQAGS